MIRTLTLFALPITPLAAQNGDRDTDGDLKCDEVAVIDSYSSINANVEHTEHTVNALRWNIDNGLYCGKSSPPPMIASARSTSAPGPTAASTSSICAAALSSTKPTSPPG